MINRSVTRYRNADFFTTNEVLSNDVMQVSSDGRILGYEADAEYTDGSAVDLGGLNVIPGLVDLQVNGASGISVSSAKKLADIASIDLSLLRQGVTRWCPTYISPTSEEMRNAAALALDAVGSSLGVIAWHFEGPWINPKRRGAHPADRIRQLSQMDIYKLVDLAKHTRVILTLAPELVPFDVVQQLSSNGIRVLAGHSAGKMDDYLRFFDAGGIGVTHIGNACGLLESREPFALGALLHRPHNIATLIADGSHLDPMSIAIIKRSLAKHQLIAISDLVAGPTSTEREFNLFSERCTRAEDGTARTTDGRLAGALKGLFQGLQTLVQRCGIPLDEATRMCTNYPSRVLGLSDTHGTLEHGAVCDMVTFSNHFVIHKVYRDGVLLHESK
ncbi:N-acetylglucosamine-6-phosphate deacetylase [Rivihabitans pingtungensis]|uniref:N-acetylglucosamine-6-phosphate deacetylase n=1 Tax=Rivihabitans pingtungensis TaxID=1054498 RepID=UPI002352111B|nr:amidohydrolase family protein [Rivihabitans pingtungensis]MCK6436855.1 amidohydrolase family protein [Rivihabitans pingtungensis]